MSDKSSFLDRMIERLDTIDSSSLQAFIMHLAREKGFLETLFNAIREGIVEIDRRLKIRYYNKAAKEMLGLPDDTSEIRISQFLRGIDWRLMLQEDKNEWQRVSRQEIEVMYPQRRILQFYLVSHEATPATATVILHDVTEARKKADSEMESRRMQVLSTLAASVAHEIGNPLNSLSLHLQLLDRSLSDENFDRNEARKLVKTAKSEVDRLDAIINQFLTAVRPKKPILAPLDLKEVIIESLNFMRWEFENRDVEVKCSWPDVLPRIKGDAGQLKQAFYNILKNSLDAMPKGGGIDIDCELDDDFVNLIFTDNGVGIKPEDIGSIFDAYNTTKEHGTGLGLMIVERIVREHGAELAIDSTPGKGTVITIRFPRGGRRMRVLPAPKEDLLIDADNNDSEQMKLF